MAKPISHPLSDWLAPWATVEIKRMFGGLGAWRDGVFFALIDDGDVYFKADAATQPDYAALGSKAFSFNRTRAGVTKVITVEGWWQVPTDILEDTDRLIVWADRAFATARAKAKPAKAPKAKGFDGLPAKARAWLRLIGVTSQADLQSLGAIDAYRQLRARYGSATTLNLLWQLYACVNRVPVNTLTPDVKDELMSLVKEVDKI